MISSRSLKKLKSMWTYKNKYITGHAAGAGACPVFFAVLSEILNFIREFNGFEYVIECYNEKFKDGDKPDSIVEIWIPLFRFCQSCFMPMPKPEEFGTEADGSTSVDYCCYCYSKGDFTCKAGFNEFVEGNIQFWRDGCKNDDEARARILEVFPKLKRWA